MPAPQSLYWCRKDCDRELCGNLPLKDKGVDPWLETKEGSRNQRGEVASGKSLFRVAGIPKHETNEGRFSLIFTDRGSKRFCLFGMSCRSPAESLFHSSLHLLTAITEPQVVDKLLDYFLPRVPSFFNIWSSWPNQNVWTVFKKFLWEVLADDIQETGFWWSVRAKPMYLLVLSHITCGGTR